MNQVLNLNLEEFYPHPLESVWRALTDPVAISEWLMPCDFQPVVGHKFTIRGNADENWRGFTHCEVLTLEAPTLMEWLWESADIEEPTRVSFALQPFQGGTRLTLRHTGTTTHKDIESLSSGWPQKIRQFKALIVNLGSSETS